jgi:hypothetical protein
VHERIQQVNKGEGTQVNNYGSISRGGVNSIDRRRSGGNNNRTFAGLPCPTLLEALGGRWTPSAAAAKLIRPSARAREIEGRRRRTRDGSYGEEASARAAGAIGDGGAGDPDKRCWTLGVSPLWVSCDFYAPRFYRRRRSFL